MPKFKMPLFFTNLFCNLFFLDINNWAPIVIPCQYFSSMFLDMIQNSTCLIPYFYYYLDLRFLYWERCLTSSEERIESISTVKLDVLQRFMEAVNVLSLLFSGSNFSKRSNKGYRLLQFIRYTCSSYVMD